MPPARARTPQYAIYNLGPDSGVRVCIGRDFLAITTMVGPAKPDVLLRDTGRLQVLLLQKFQKRWSLTNQAKYSGHITSTLRHQHSRGNVTAVPANLVQGLESVGTIRASHRHTTGSIIKTQVKFQDYHFPTGWRVRRKIAAESGW